MKQYIHINRDKARIGRFWQPIVLLLAACLICACNNESEIVEPAGTSSLGVQGVYNPGSEVVTRAASTTPVTSGSIGIFRETDTYYTTLCANVKYTYTSGKWALAAGETNKILLGAQDCLASLYAYYPNAGKISVEADNKSVKLNAQAYDADYDLCYCSSGSATATDAGGLVYNFHPGVAFTMKRAYTQIAVKLTRGVGYKATGNITAISVKVSPDDTGRYYSSGTQDISSGTYTPGTADKSEIIYTVPADTKLAATNASLQVNYLLPPGKSGAVNHLILSITADGTTAETKISVAGIVNMEAGKCYVLHALLNYDALAVNGIQVVDEWDSQPSFDGDAEFVEPTT